MIRFWLEVVGENCYIYFGCFFFLFFFECGGLCLGLGLFGIGIGIGIGIGRCLPGQRKLREYRVKSGDKNESIHKGR